LSRIRRSRRPLDIDAVRSQVRQLPTHPPQKPLEGPRPAVRLRHVFLTFLPVKSFRIVGESADRATDVTRPASRRRLLFAAGAVVLGTAAWFGWHWLTYWQYLESTDDAYVGGEVTTLSFKVAGLIETIAIVDNQFVKAGDLLLKLDDRDYRAQLAHAEATIAARRAALANLDATRKMRVAMVDQVRADLAAAMAERVRATFDVDRYRTLNSDRFASRQRFEQADADNEKAHAGERKAQAALEAAEHELDVTDAQRQQAAADLDQAVADGDLARLNLSYTEIRSPIDGVVGNRSARVGAYATIGVPLLAIVPAHGLWVDANFRESQLVGMREGQPAEIFADAVPGLVLRGRLQSLSPATGAQFSVLPPENATGNFTKVVQRVPVRILLDGDGAELGKLRPGLSVVARVDERQSVGRPVDGRQNTRRVTDKRQGVPAHDDQRPATAVDNDMLPVTYFHDVPQ
jgi:membrane fusion protein, multidrug efflux system